MRAIFEFSGPKGVGKSTYVQLMVQELARETVSSGEPSNMVLLIDASSDLDLTRKMAPAAVEKTLAALVEKIKEEAPLSNEAMDSVFAQLAVSVDETTDLIPVGPLSSPLSVEGKNLLTYGLVRFLTQHYQFTVVDGFHDSIHQVLPKELLRSVVVVTPAMAVALPRLVVVKDAPPTPFVVLNRVSEGVLPKTLEEALDAGQVQLVGKIPEYEEAEIFEKYAPAAFANAMLRLDVPFQEAFNHLIVPR